jgi:thiamine-phosphate pyrophosphorylase
MLQHRLQRVALRRGLYAITPDLMDTGKLLDQAAAAIAGGAVLLQYRNKTAAPATRQAQAAALSRLCHDLGVPLIVNDDAALAVEVDAAGAHLGIHDGDAAAARTRLGERRVVGVSCYNRIDLAERAAGLGADYVAFGSFFASATKPDAVCAAPALISEAKTRFGLPVAAIGGIDPGNASVLIDAGADWLCVISALFGAADIEAAARRLSSLFAEGQVRHPPQPVTLETGKSHE